MAKLALLFATFALVLFLANASIYRTTITVDEDENKWPWQTSRPQGRCQQQLQRANYLRQCQRYVEERTRSSRYNPSSGSEYLDSCCEQLEKLDKQCRCPGLQQAVKQQTQQGQLGKEEIREMFEVAERLVNKCDIEPRWCEFQPRSWF